LPGERIDEREDLVDDDRLNAAQEALRFHAARHQHRLDRLEIFGAARVDGSRRLRTDRTVR
jgi:hypothetical protein